LQPAADRTADGRSRKRSLGIFVSIIRSCRDILRFLPCGACTSYLSATIWIVKHIGSASDRPLLTPTLVALLRFVRCIRRSWEFLNDEKFIELLLARNAVKRFTGVNACTKP